jgi:cell division topological specificity factor
MGSFMDRLMGRKPNPAQSAKDRLKLVLVTDRVSLSPEEMKSMQQEILEVIRKYVRVEESDIELKYEQRDRENFLVADIPLKGKTGEVEGNVHLEINTDEGESPALDEPTQVDIVLDAEEDEDDR